MTKQLLVLGDSFCHGIGTYSSIKCVENINFAFGKYVADKLNLQYVNIAEPGIANARIVELGYNYITEHKNDIELIIIGWTHPTRIGLYSDINSLQLLPQFCWLGDNSETDIFVRTDNSVKFIVDQKNKDYLDILPAIHQLLVTNNFFEGQQSVSKMVVDCFLSWVREQKLKVLDFDVFPELNLHQSNFEYSFNKVMPVFTRHPTKDEQQIFANLLIEYLYEHKE